MIRMPNLPGSCLRIRLWETTFGLFLAVCLPGTISHGFILSPQTRAFLWNILFTLLGFMITSLMTCFLYEVKGSSCLKPAIIAAVILAIGFSLAKNVILRGKGFIVFIAFSGSIILFSFLLLLLHVRKKPWLNWFIISLLFLAAGSVIEGTKRIRFHFILDFDFNGVYHLFTLVFALFICKGIREAAKADIWHDA